MSVRQIDLSGFTESFIGKLLGGLMERSPEDLIRMARAGEPPHPDCVCIKCSFARGEMPKAPDPSDQDGLTKDIVRAIETVQETCERSLKAGIAESRDLVATPYPPEVERLLIAHRVERYNVSARTVRALNELLPPEQRLPNRMLHEEMRPADAMQTLVTARERLAAKLAEHMAQQAGDKFRAAEAAVKDAVATAEASTADATAACDAAEAQIRQAAATVGIELP